MNTPNSRPGSLPANLPEGSTAPTAKLVPLADLVAFARQVKRMREAQSHYFRARKAQPHAAHNVEHQDARGKERDVDSAAAAILARDRQSLPGLDLEPEPAELPDPLAMLKRVSRFLGGQAQHNRLAAQLRDETQAVIAAHEQQRGGVPPQAT